MDGVVVGRAPRGAGGRFWARVGVGLLWAAAVSAPPAEAEACGGTFCDNPGPNQPPMPVDQTGENVLFVMADGEVEAHIQIQYSGDPERFAWLIPVPVTPQFAVGSQQLFVNLQNASVPTFSLTSRFDGCGGGFSESSSDGSGCSSSAESGDTLAGGGGTPEERTDSDSEVVSRRERVGVFDVSVLEGASPEDVETWLTDNGYLSTPTAPGILRDYSERDYVFVAVKLRSGAGVREIHPLVIRYAGSEPCVPLKLTAIAAQENMDVRAFFLGDKRVVPTGFKHVELNQAHLDWLNFGQDYKTTVSLAVDSPVANGRAFITEYAGTSSVVPEDGILDSRWDADAFAALEPAAAMNELSRQGLFACSLQGCSAGHPLVEPILAHYLPIPEGITRDEFYGCVDCFDVTHEAWDAQAFALDIAERIVEPAQHALTSLRGAPYLTRLYTRISPSEMTEDPMFAEHANLPEVSADLAARTRTLCGGDSALYTPEGRQIRLGSGLSSPALPSMPYAERVTEYQADGSEAVLVNNTATIKRALDEYNAGFSFESAEPAGGAARRDSGGCFCSARPGQTQQGAVLGLALFGMLLRRRGRRRARS